MTEVVNRETERRSLWRILLILVMVVGTVGGFAGAGWLLVRSFDRGMSVHTYESADDARSLARSLGLALADDDHVEYGLYTSAFQDPGAYLVVVTSSSKRLAQIVHDSGLPAPSKVTVDAPLRSPDDHGPPRTPTLVTSTVVRYGNYLIAYWDPVRAPRRLYVDAFET